MHAEIHFTFRDCPAIPMPDEKQKKVWEILSRAEKQMRREFKKEKIRVGGHFIYKGDEPFYAPLLRN